MTTELAAEFCIRDWCHCMNTLSAVLFVTFPMYAQHTFQPTANCLNQQQNKWKEMKENTENRNTVGRFNINRGALAWIYQSISKFRGRNKLPYQKYIQLIWIITFNFFFRCLMTKKLLCQWYSPASIVIKYYQT